MARPPSEIAKPGDTTTTNHSSQRGIGIGEGGLAYDSHKRIRLIQAHMTEPGSHDL